MAGMSLRQQRFLPVGPLLLMALGAVLLMNNLGLLSWQIWPTMLRLWPLVLVLLGLQALATGRVDWISLVALLAVFALLALATRFVFPIPRLSAASALPTADSFRQELQGAQRASVGVEFGGGEVSIGSLDETGLLARGELAAEGGGRLTTQYRVREGVGALEVRAGRGRPGPPFFFFNRNGSSSDRPRPPFFQQSGSQSDRLSLALARGVPLDLEVQAGAADASLDLRELTVPSLRYHTGATRSTIILPAFGMSRVDVQAGAAVVNLEVPPGTAARIRTTGSGLSQVDVDQTRFPLVGETYESPDYAGASNRVDLVLNVGATSVSVR
jgi:hypothetical protein